MNIKRTVNFKLEQRKKKGVAVTENVPIRMRLTFDGNRIEFSTGYRIDADKWDTSKQRVKPKYTNKQKVTAAEINATLNNYEMLVQDVFKDFEVQDVMPTTAQFKEHFEWYLAGKPEIETPEVDNSTNKYSFWDVYDMFQEESGRMNEWTKATFIKFNTLKNYLNAFRDEITFEYFDHNGLNAFVSFLRDKKNLRNSTIRKQMGFLKWVLRWAHQKHYSDNCAYMTFKAKLKTAEKTVIFLRPDELKAVEDTKIPAPKQYLERVRDVFLFCCYTGLRYSDVNNLRRSDIKENHISVTTIKNVKAVDIDLNDYSRAILAKYENFVFKGDKALPVISAQRMNEYLKELMKLAKINEPVRLTYYKGNERYDEVYPKHELIATHAARRTFICFAISIGIPPEVVMKWTGHRSYRAIEPYIAICDKTKSEAMVQFNLARKNLGE